MAKKKEDLQTEDLDINKAGKFYEKSSTVAIAIGALFFVAGAIIFLNQDSNLEQYGAFGEFFGGIIGSFWSLAGVLLFYAALKTQSKEFIVQRQQLEMQRKELKLQRNELKLQRYETELQRKEFERQTEQLIHQNATLAVQKFENTFFHLLGLHNDIVNSNEARELGKKWAKELYLRFIGNYQRISAREEELNKLELIQKAYHLFPKRIEYFDRYFNNLYYVLKFIHRSNMEDKHFYASIVRAQLTVFEQLFLFYYGISDFSTQEFKEILQTYHFFEEIPLDELIDMSHTEYYSQDAFGKQVK
jgi:hypothetical protein